MKYAKTQILCFPKNETTAQYEIFRVNLIILVILEGK